MRKREGAKETGAEGKRYKRGKKRTEVNERDRKVCVWGGAVRYNTIFCF